MVSKVAFVVVLVAAMAQIAFSYDDLSPYNYRYPRHADDLRPREFQDFHQGRVESRQFVNAPQLQNNENGQVLSHTHSSSWNIDSDGKKTEQHEAHIRRRSWDGQVTEETYKS